MANPFDQFDEQNPFDRFGGPPAVIELSGMAVPDKPAKVEDFSGTLRFGPLDTGIRLPEGVNRRLAQFASGVANLGAAFDAPEAVDAKRARDAQLNDDFMGKALNFAGNVAPGMAIPTLGGPVLGGALAGTIMGATTPVGTGESRLLNTITGGGLGAALPGAVGLARNMVRPDPKAADLARKAIDQYDIPLSPTDITSNGLAKGARSMLDDLPFIGRIGANQQAAKQEAFNAAIGSTFGAPEKSLTPGVMQQAKGRIGGELDRIWNNNTLDLDPKYFQDLQRIGQRAQNLNPEQQAVVSRQIQNLLQQAQNAKVPGAFTNNWQSELRLAAEGEKGLMQSVLSDLRKSTIAAFNRGVGSQDAAALTKARSQYGAYKTVEPLMSKAEAGVAGRVAGDVPAALLPQRVADQYGSRISQSPFEDLSAIAGRFMVDRVPRTGGSARAAIQNSALGAGLGLGAFHEPLSAAAGLGSAAVLEKLLSSPALARLLLNQGPSRGLFDSPDLQRALLELGGNSLFRLPAAAGIGTLSALE